MEQKLLPKTNCPLVVRTDFENQQTWDTICDLIRAPVPEGNDHFYAYVEFLEEPELRELTETQLLARVPDGYGHTFLLVVDKFTTQHPEFPILVIDLHHERGRTFRAIPSRIQSIENNLSIANMDFFEFADNVDEDGVFRGFPGP
jgi:hypothetical protein